MSTVQSESKILVTGANGYIASWIVSNLLSKGYSVLGTVRSSEKGTRLREIFSQYGDKFEFVVVPDITQEGAFDEAVKGVDAILHTASPVVTLKADDPEELIRPAVRGTVGILQSALTYGVDVKRVVYTSSSAAIIEVHPEPRTFSEADWNTQSVEILEREGRNAPQLVKYRTSKTLAEQAAWKFMADNKEHLKWDLVTLNPPFVFGPVIHDVPTPSALNDSTALMYTIVQQSEDSEKILDMVTSLRTGNCWVDVRDVGEAHVLALEKENVANERIIISAGSFIWQEWRDIANAIQPTHLPSHPNLRKGEPILPGTEIVYGISFDTSKVNRLLGIKFRTKEEVLKDTFADYERRGW